MTRVIVLTLLAAFLVTDGVTLVVTQGVALAAEKPVKLSRTRVRELQQALKASGQDPGPVDGVLGPRTKAALRRYASSPSPSAVPATATIDRFRRDYPTMTEQSP